MSLLYLGFKPQMGRTEEFVPVYYYFYYYHFGVYYYYYYSAAAETALSWNDRTP